VYPARVASRGRGTYTAWTVDSVPLFSHLLPFLVNYSFPIFRSTFDDLMSSKNQIDHPKIPVKD